MYKIETSKQFQKDLNLAKKLHLNIDQLFDVVEKLANDMPLSSKNKDHALKGNFIGYRECHINPDWLLIYKKRYYTQNYCINSHRNTFRFI